jgi:hypothetical protein
LGLFLLTNYKRIVVVETRGVWYLVNAWLRTVQSGSEVDLKHISARPTTSVFNCKPVQSGQIKEQRYAWRTALEQYRT